MEDIFRSLEELAAEIKKYKKCVFLGAPILSNEKIYNACLILKDGLVEIGSKKVHLPNYDVFDERRYFSTSDNISVVRLDGITIGFPICEDSWFPDVISNMKEQGAELIVVTNGSPYETGKLQERHRLIKKRCYETELPIIYLNLVGGQDELVFDGGSFVCDKKGKIVEQFPQFKEFTKQLKFEKLSRDVHPFPKKSEIKSLPHLRQDYEALVLGLRDYVIKSKFKKVVLGLSGGVDSALVAVIAKDALGSENVLCVALPSKFNSSASLTDAQALADNLCVKLKVLNLETMVSVSEEVLSPLFVGKERDITEENIQSRLRAVLLMAISNKFGYLLLSTGNKSEVAVGYSTIYGDMAGGFNPLKDVYKTKVYNLCHLRNEMSLNNGNTKEIIPINILTKEPSAELAFNQKDSDSLPDYCELDPILENLIEGDLSVKELIHKGFKKDVVLMVQEMIYRSEYKRYQSAPGTKISKRPFALGRRYPLVNQWRDKF